MYSPSTVGFIVYNLKEYGSPLDSNALLFQLIQINRLSYLELEAYGLFETLSEDLFDNLLYFILHQKWNHVRWARFQHTVGVLIFDSVLLLP